MWIMSQHGFYSIVQHNAEPDTFLVRARVRQDLVNLQALVPLAGEIVSYAGSDYPYRVFVSRNEVAAIMARLGETIDYPNFKNHIHSLPDQKAKSGAYMKVWSALHGVETRNAHDG